MSPEEEMKLIREVMEAPTRICQHEYLPDEDGTVYTCGSDFDVEHVYSYGFNLCLKHRLEYYEKSDSL